MFPSAAPSRLCLAAALMLVGCPDNGMTPDIGVVDLGPDTPCKAKYADCATYDDMTSKSAVIAFGGSTGFKYAPKCLKVRAGQRVVFRGDSFELHPMKQACGPAKKAVRTVIAGSEATMVLNEPGIYGYYCVAHGTEGGSGMAGSIEVVR